MGYHLFSHRISRVYGSCFHHRKINGDAKIPQLFFQVNTFLKKLNKIFKSETNIPYQPIDYDDDVAKEMTKIETASPADYAVFVKDLRKVYMLGGGKKKVAVTKSSFGIENGECFGLLGVNGAGKTTTFKMLCGEIPPTSGTVKLTYIFI